MKLNGHITIGLIIVQWLLYAYYKEIALLRVVKLLSKPYKGSYCFQCRSASLQEYRSNKNSREKTHNKSQTFKSNLSATIGLRKVKIQNMIDFLYFVQTAPGGKQANLINSKLTILCLNGSYIYILCEFSDEMKSYNFSENQQQLHWQSTIEQFPRKRQDIATNLLYSLEYYSTLCAICHMNLSVDTTNNVLPTYWSKNIMFQQISNFSLFRTHDQKLFPMDTQGGIKHLSKYRLCFKFIARINKRIGITILYVNNIYFISRRILIYPFSFGISGNFPDRQLARDMLKMQHNASRHPTDFVIDDCYHFIIKLSLFRQIKRNMLLIESDK